jgi:NAD-dependent dihydropyrimidine dehydrogenase PreA subunit
MRYLEKVVTLEYDRGRCQGCGRCAQVCPRAVFAMNANTAELIDRDACIECGACRRNCPHGAIKVRAGVGCAQAVIRSNHKSAGPCCG